MDWLYILSTICSILLLYFWLKPSRAKNYPPGPKGLPFLGNILSFSKLHLSMLKWKEEYGDIFSVYSGRKPMVILNNFNTVRKVFSDDTVSGRDPRSHIRVDSETHLESGLFFSQGEMWKTHRRFALSTLRDLGMGKNWLEDTIITEVEGICQTLKNTNGKPFNPKVQLTNSVSNVICALIFGEKFSLTDPKFSRLTGLVSENVESLPLDEFSQAFPFLMWFPNYIRSHIIRARANFRAVNDFLRTMVVDHDKVIDKQSVPDYLFAYQAERENGQPKTSPFDETQLIVSLSDLFAAGTETTSTTTLWAFVFMVENPEVMRKVQEEIDNNVGRDRMLTNSDRSLLPYTEAVILEIQRCASLVPLGAPHSTREEIIIDGFTIPKDTIIFANLFSIHRDPRWWKNPEKFDPHRFLDENMKLTRPDGFIPFSIGKRACLGEALAKMELFLFIANLLRCFTIKVPAGKSISHEDYLSSVVNSPIPFEYIFISRV